MSTICTESGLSFLDCFCKDCQEFREEVAGMVYLYENHPDRREILRRWFDRFGLTTSGIPVGREPAPVLPGQETLEV